MPPKKGVVFRFKVSGSGYFPLDMLRYDRCWPSNESGVNAIIHSREERVGEFASHRLPTYDRWASFGWTVHE